MKMRLKEQLFLVTFLCLGILNLRAGLAEPNILQQEEGQLDLRACEQQGLEYKLFHMCPEAKEIQRRADFCKSHPNVSICIADDVPFEERVKARREARTFDPYDEARPIYQSACFKHDFGPACALLAESYLDVENIEPGIAQARELFQKSCDLNFGAGCTGVGRLLESDDVVRDYEGAAHFYQKGCEAGDTGGCVLWGKILVDGHLDTTDLVKARELFDDACDDGYPSGCGHLGELYQNGAGVMKNFAKAALLFEQACRWGFAEACHNLGFLYETGALGDFDGVFATKNNLRACQLAGIGCVGFINEL